MNATTTQLAARITELEAQVAYLTGKVLGYEAELGISRPAEPSRTDEQALREVEAAGEQLRILRAAAAKNGIAL